MSKIAAIYKKLDNGESLTNEEGRFLRWALSTFKEEFEAQRNATSGNPKALHYSDLIKFIAEERKLVDMNKSTIETYHKRIREFKDKFLSEPQFVQGKDGYFRIKK